MLRITRIDRDEEGVVLKLEGRLVDEWVDLLRETCEAHQRKMETPLSLDLSAVAFADKEGRELLRRLKSELKLDFLGDYWRRSLVDRANPILQQTRLLRYGPCRSPDSSA